MASSACRFVTQWGQICNYDKFGNVTDQRSHNPGTGRFMTPDPYQASGDLGDPGSWNRYAYVGGRHSSVWNYVESVSASHGLELGRPGAS